MATGLMKVSGAKSLGQGFQSSHLNTSLAHKVETFGSILAAAFLNFPLLPFKMVRHVFTYDVKHWLWSFFKVSLNPRLRKFHN